MACFLVMCIKANISSSSMKMCKANTPSSAIKKVATELDPTWKGMRLRDFERDVLCGSDEEGLKEFSKVKGKKIWGVDWGVS